MTEELNQTNNKIEEEKKKLKILQNKRRQAIFTLFGLFMIMGVIATIGIITGTKAQVPLTFDTNDNLGVGTNTPSQRVEVYGNINISGDLAVYNKTITNTSHLTGLKLSCSDVTGSVSNLCTVTSGSATNESGMYIQGNSSTYKQLALLNESNKYLQINSSSYIFLYNQSLSDAYNYSLATQNQFSYLWYNQSLASFNQYGIFWYNQTQSAGSTFNATYDGYNISYGKFWYNYSLADLFNYNQSVTNETIKYLQINQSTRDGLNNESGSYSPVKFGYNMTVNQLNNESVNLIQGNSSTYKQLALLNESIQYLQINASTLSRLNQAYNHTTSIITIPQTWTAIQTFNLNTIITNASITNNLAVFGNTTLQNLTITDLKTCTLKTDALGSLYCGTDNTVASSFSNAISNLTALISTDNRVIITADSLPTNNKTLNLTLNSNVPFNVTFLQYVAFNDSFRYNMTTPIYSMSTAFTTLQTLNQNITFTGGNITQNGNNSGISRGFGDYYNYWNGSCNIELIKNIIRTTTCM